MRKLYQPKRERGDGECLSVCIAMLLGVKSKDVLYYPKEKGWEQKYNSWLSKNHKVCIAFVAQEERPPVGYYIAVGTVKGQDSVHAVIYKDGALYHDPRRGGDGLVEELYFIVLYPKNINLALKKIKKHREGDFR